MPRRSQPLLIAPLIPLLGVIGIFGAEELHGSRYLPAFVIAWCALLAALFAFVLNKAMEAKRRRASR